MKIYSTITKYDEKYSNIFDREELKGKRQHVEKVQAFTENLLSMPHNEEIDTDLLRLCAKHHDDGRVKQFEILGKFWDTEVSHNVLGLDLFDKFLQANCHTSLNESVQIFRDVLLYHGRPQLCLSSASKPYVELVTAADDLENAASYISYLVKEVENDEKGYRHDNPDADQKYVSDFVFEHFASGEKFDKMKYCTTYAEYVLFAATLMTSCIKKYKFAKYILLEPGYGYDSIVLGYKDVFYKTLTEEMAEKCHEILCNYALD